MGAFVDRRYDTKRRNYGGKNEKMYGVVVKLQIKETIVTRSFFLFRVSGDKLLETE